jgi:hypothetical protein
MAPPAADVEDIGDNTSLVTVLSSAHGRQRREERDITKRDLQAAVKYGKKEPAPHPQGQSTDRLKYTFAGIVYITDSESRVEITSWPEDDQCGFDVPLIRITDAMAAEHDTAVADLRNLGGWTSHTVIVVDQSGSMRRTDVEGKATRAEAVWLTLAFTCVGDELRSGNRKGSDVMSIIGMRKTAELLVDREPMDWLLYNKIVGFLRNERPGGDGKYTGAIELAEACLQGNTRGSCALALLFLSDGKPSDELETSSTSTWKKSCDLTKYQRARRRESGLTRTSKDSERDRDKKLGAHIGNLASRFGRRLTVGTIGFADSTEEFAALKTLTAECAAYDCQASFHSPALTAHSLKQVLTSLSSTLTATKTEMTALGGSAQRTVRNVLRESKTGAADDMCANEDNWWLFDGSDVMERVTWDSDKANATRGKDPWTHHLMYLHENANGVAMRSKIFGEGAERMVSKFREYDTNLNFVGPWMVAKESRYVQEETGGDLRDCRLFHATFCKTQQKADRIAREFNIRLATIPGVTSETPRIRFLDCHVYVLHDRGMGTVGVLVEKMLDVSRYKKWNTNNGGVDGVPSVYVEEEPDPGIGQLLDGIKDLGLGAIGEEEEGEEDSDEEDGAENGSASESRPVAARVGDAAISFTTADIPQAFSCFSYRFTGKKFLVCDLQGVLDVKSSPPCFELTDPVIHYRSMTGRRGVFGRTDRGPKGIDNFYRTHQCTELCRALMREWINLDVQRRETPHPSGRTW